MYTAQSIRDIEFQKSGFNGVKTSDVEVFVEEVANDFETLERKNQELLSKLQVLAETIEEYRKSEDSVKTAILAAQKTADAMLKDAEAKATELLEEKTRQAEQLEKATVEASEKLMAEATEKSRKMLDEATMKSNQIMAESENMLAKKKAEIDRLVNQQMLTYNYVKDEVKKFKENIINNYKLHLDNLQSVPMTSKNLEVYAKNQQEEAADNEPNEEISSNADDSAK